MSDKCPICGNFIMTYLVSIPQHHSMLDDAERVSLCACGNGVERMTKYVNRHRNFEACLQEYVDSMAEHEPDQESNASVHAARGAERFGDYRPDQRSVSAQRQRIRDAASCLRDAAKLAKLPDNLFTLELTR